MRIFVFILLTGFCLSIFASCSFSQEWKLSSPDKRAIISISNKPLPHEKNVTLSYLIHYGGKTVVARSPLGIDRNDGQFSQNLKLVTVLPAQTIDETYTLKSGKKLECRNYFNEQVFVFKNEQNARMHLIVRAYNDGIAFRYYFPGKQKTTLRIVNEKTGFFIPKDGKAWIQPYDWNVRLKPSYEQYYRNEMAVGDPSPNKTGWAYPLLFHRDNVWMMITEATLDGSYCATHVNNTPDGLYTIAFAEKEEVVIPDDPEPVVSLPLATPWRTIILSDDLSGIVETNLVQNLNRPCALQDVSWILPGRSSWSWWHNGSTVRDYNAQIQYVNLSAEMGWEYMLIDSGWEKMQGGTMEDVVGYANQKGVGVWLWYHSGSGRENDSITQRNIMAFPELRRAEFQYLQKTGVKGVKIDFFDTDKQGIVQRYEEILADAAACHIMVNFHGATLPRGLERTYPNLMTVEAVKGAEGFGRQPSCDNAPWHNATLPFTRNVVGSMDYTPVTFSNKIKEGVEAQQVTTWGHQLALSVVFESGVQNFADKAESYLSLPEAPKTFLQNIPVAWDETKLAAGYPGDFVVMARRKGNGWYIGGINGKNEARRITFELPFIPAGKDIHFITDGEDKKTFTEKTAVTGQTIEIAVLPYGGFAGTTIESLLK